MTKITLINRTKSFLRIAKLNKQGVYELPLGKLKYAKYANGKFATCPICNSSMAHNVMGHYVCIFGCGLPVKESCND